VNGPKIYCALPTSSLRTIVSPALLIPNCGWLSPESSCFGTKPLAHFSLAQALFFQKEFQSFRNAAARAVELNPMDGNSLAFLGELLIYAGDSERGLSLAERAKQLNPNHPGWYWHANFNHAYREGDYRGALACALKSNMTVNWGRHALIAAANFQSLASSGRHLQASHAVAAPTNIGGR